MNHKSFKLFKTFATLTLIFLCYFLTYFVTPAQADVIYHAFNEPFDQIRTELPQLRQQSYTYIQISPPQLSNPSSEWWGRYQPIDFTVLDSPLGNENDLQELIGAAHQQGEKIIVDVVLNHMANYGDYPNNLQYTHFSPEDFHPKVCIQNYDDHYQATQGWLGLDCSSGEGGLPDLNTESSHVQQEAKNYLTKLLALGVDGFRIDALKHIEEGFFEKVLEDVPSNIYLYGEVVEGRPIDSLRYTGIHNIDITDYPLLGAIKNAFGLNGDLRSLINPTSYNAALPGSNAVTFAKTHDTLPGTLLYGSYGMDQLDSLLANAFVLARADGLPLIYRDDASESIVQAGVLFHEQMMGQPQYFRNGNEIASGADNPNLLFIERGNQGIVMINKSGNFFDVPVAQMPGLDVGCYQELHYNFTMSVALDENGNKSISRWGSPAKGGIQIGPRDALFFVNSSDQSCQ